MSDYQKAWTIAGNYICDDDTNPTWVLFRNGRYVRIVDGVLKIDWARGTFAPENESFIEQLLWRFGLRLSCDTFADAYKRGKKHAADEIDRLTRELAAAKADAERYRWLRNKAPMTICSEIFGRSTKDSCDGESTLDALIDAAIAEKPTDKAKQ